MRVIPFLITILTCHLAAAVAVGQGTIKLPPAKNTKFPGLIPVMVPSATCAAISEAAGWLAFGHDRNFADANVSLVKLDAKGNPGSYAIPIKLPKGAGLVKNPNYAVSVTFHPKLPLLYVWQDVALQFTNPPAAQHPDLDKFDHLLIYSVAKDTPELLASLCRGVDYIYGCAGGSIVVDAGASILYVPNVRDPKNAGIFKFGRFVLDEAGLPRLDDKDAALPVPARLKRLAELNNAKPLTPHQVTPPEYVNLFPFNAAGCGLGFLPLSKDVVLAGGWNGLLSWRPDDKNVAVSGVSFRHSGNKLVAAHPGLSIIYATVLHSNFLYRAEHADGYLTLVPQGYELADGNVLSAPVIMAKGKKLAVGGRHRVYFLDLDEQGKLRPEVTQVQVFNPTVMALVYSERYDRLYVAQEVGK